MTFNLLILMINTAHLVRGQLFREEQLPMGLEISPAQRKEATIQYESESSISASPSYE